MGFESQHVEESADKRIAELNRALLDAPITPSSKEKRGVSREERIEADEKRERENSRVLTDRLMLTQDWTPSGFHADAINIVIGEIEAIEYFKTKDGYAPKSLKTFEEYISPRSESERTYLRERTGAENIAKLDAQVKEFNQAQSGLAEAKDWDGLLERLHAILALIKGGTLDS
jgi:hypothetical protein